MFNPEKIDLQSLPWLPLEEKTAFPKRSAIYFAIDWLGDIQYIGRSVNVRQRWGNHHKYDELANIGNIKIAYLFIDSIELLPEIEAALINWFSPPLNTGNHGVRKTHQTLNESTTLKIILKETRQNKKMSREELAVKSGISVSYIQKLEQNAARRISLDIYDKLCKALGCDISGILRFSQDDVEAA